MPISLQLHFLVPSKLLHIYKRRWTKLQCIISRDLYYLLPNSDPPWSLLLLSTFDGRLYSTKNEHKNEHSWRFSSTEWWWIFTSGKVYRIVVHFSPEAQQHSCIYVKIPSFNYSWNLRIICFVFFPSIFSWFCLLYNVKWRYCPLWRPNRTVALSSKHKGEKYRERKQ